MEQLKRVSGLQLESQGQHLAVTVLHVPHLLDSGPEAWSEKAGGRTCSRCSGRSRPHTLHQTTYTLHPTPYTLHPTPHPTPYTLHPAPYSLHPTPYTLHPTPYNLHPTPYTLHLVTNSGRGTTRAEDPQGTPALSHISPSILVYPPPDPTRGNRKLTAP